jgi:hypothetical protein
MLPQVVVMAVKKSLQLQESKSQQPMARQPRQNVPARTRKFANNPQLNQVLNQTANSAQPVNNDFQSPNYGVDLGGRRIIKNGAGSANMPMYHDQMMQPEVMQEAAGDIMFHNPSDQGVTLGQDHPVLGNFLNRDYSQVLKATEEKVRNSRPA